MEISLPIPGGKFRIWKEICKYFPLIGNTYIELFAGRGNIFFNFKQIADYGRWIINDKFNGRFFKAIKIVNIADLPREVTDATFEEWKIKSLLNDPVALILEPVITFKGKGYDAGCGVNSSHSRYNYEIFKKKLIRMQYLLNDVTILQGDWIDVDIKSLLFDDFIYCDPPYLHTESVGYPNINHEELILKIFECKCQWAISGYETELYLQLLGEPIVRIERNLEMSNKSNQVIECLWINY